MLLAFSESMLKADRLLSLRHQYTPTPSDLMARPSPPSHLPCRTPVDPWSPLYYRPLAPSPG